MLSVCHLRKSFGGIAATCDVSFEVAEREIHGLIGPNGAGKSTLVGQIAGMLRPASGTVHFREQDITRTSPQRRVALGLARSFQITSLWLDLTILENVVIGAQRALGSPFRFWKPALADKSAVRVARETLADLGLLEREAVLARSLSYGEQKQLELAIVLAGRPRLLLLDEPFAGVGGQETEALVSLIERIRSEVSILLIEHDMDAMFRLADRISVLHQGRIIVTGDAATVRADEHVRRAYLGEDDDAPA